MPVFVHRSCITAFRQMCRTKCTWKSFHYGEHYIYIYTFCNRSKSCRTKKHPLKVIL